MPSISWALALAASLALCFSSTQGEMYQGYQLLKVIPATPQEVEVLNMLKKEGVQFTMHDPKMDTSCEMLVSPEQSYLVNSLLMTYGINATIKFSDVGKEIQSQAVSSFIHDGKLDWDVYYTLDAIYEYLEEQASITHPNAVATLRNLGSGTYEGRNLTMIKISNTKGTQPKPIVYLESNIHAREWITSAVGTFIIDQLLNGPDAEMLSYVDTFDFYIVPIANPDGFDYTHTTDRFWRKTRSNTTSPLGCMGADPNRNWDAFWMQEGGASDDPCSNTYAGPEPFSEPEVLAMAQFLNETAINENLAMYLSLHSAGQYLLIPTGLNNVSIPNYDAYMDIAHQAAIAHMSVEGKNYTAGSIFNLMYPATGSSLDWAYIYANNTRAKFHVTYELRDKGQYGHLLPPSQILPSCLEFLAGFKVIMNYLMAP